MLRSSGDFVRYVLSVAVQKIQQLEETGHTDGPDGQNPDKTFRFLCDMTRSESVGSQTFRCRSRPGSPCSPKHTFLSLQPSSRQRADVALHQHPQRGGGRRQEREALQHLPAVPGRSAENLYHLPREISREDVPAALQNGSDTRTHTHLIRLYPSLNHFNDCLHPHITEYLHKGRFQLFSMTIVCLSCLFIDCVFIHIVCVATVHCIVLIRVVC